MTIFAVNRARHFRVVYSRPWFDYMLFPYLIISLSVVAKFQLTSAVGCLRCQRILPYRWYSAHRSYSWLHQWSVTVLLNQQKNSLVSFIWLGGGARHWSRFEEVSLCLRVLQPLVFSVHSIVSFDFCPVYCSGLYMPPYSRHTSWPVRYSRASAWCLTLMLIVRKIYKLGRILPLSTSVYEHSNYCYRLNCGVAYLTELFAPVLRGVEGTIRVP